MIVNNPLLVEDEQQAARNRAFLLEKRKRERQKTHTLTKYLGLENLLQPPWEAPLYNPKDIVEDTRRMSPVAKEWR